MVGKWGKPAACQCCLHIWYM